MSNRQYIACRFPNQTRVYTYHNDGDPVAVGDKVIVESRTGRAFVEVVSLSDDKPPFETKEILGLAPPREEPAAAEDKVEG